MKNIIISKASDVYNIKEVESVMILVDQNLPKFTKEFDLDHFTNLEAKKLEEALHQSLPGATYNRLYKAMVERVLSNLIVRYP